MRGEPSWNTTYVYNTDLYKSVEEAINNKGLRRLTPIECERLQTLPDNYTNGISIPQRYKTLGNGWTVDIITYILSHIDE